MKLKIGDEIRVIAPSRNMKILSDETINTAIKRLEELGFKVTFGKNVYNSINDVYGCASIEDRVKDLHEAFLDKNVKAILTVLGGFNVNQILDYIDYDIIKNNPKIICGFSDITALLNAIYAKTGMVTFSGPHFSSFGMLKGIEYTAENMQKMLFGDGKNQLHPSPEWSDDLWFLDQNNRTFIRNEGYWKLQGGNAEGTLIGGNLCTFNLLLGTQYRPAFTKNTVLFIEDTENSNIAEFTRNFQAIIQQPDFANVKAVLIGRFQKKSEVTREQLEFMINRFAPKLKGLPIIANLDFGHSTPLLTIPVGGTAKIDQGGIKIEA